MKVRMQIWAYAWALLCKWTPKPLNPWRLLVLRAFGARISGKPFVHQRMRVHIPWNLILHDRATVGDRANMYNMAEVEIGARAIVAQETYLCTGTHDFDDPHLPLQTARVCDARGERGRAVDHRRGVGCHSRRAAGRAGGGKSLPRDPTKIARGGGVSEGKAEG